MTYLEYKREFFRRHGGMKTVETSPMDEGDSYHKTYVANDKTVMYEVNRPVWETVRAYGEVRGIVVLLEEDVKLLETEVWSTEDAKSVKFYERW